MRLKILILLVFLKVFALAAQGPTNNVRPTGGITLMVTTNGVLIVPTNFFAANSNLMNYSVGGGGGGGGGATNGIQQLNGFGTNTSLYYPVFPTGIMTGNGTNTNALYALSGTFSNSITASNVTIIGGLVLSKNPTNGNVLFEDGSGSVYSSNILAKLQFGSANLTNWSTISTNQLLSYQAGAANLTNWSAVLTNILLTLQQASANLTNWSAIATNQLLNYQAASANLTNLSAIATNQLTLTNDTRSLNLSSTNNALAASNIVAMGSVIVGGSPANAMGLWITNGAHLHFDQGQGGTSGGDSYWNPAHATDGEWQMSSAGRISLLVGYNQQHKAAIQLGAPSSYCPTYIAEEDVPSDGYILGNSESLNFATYYGHPVGGVGQGYVWQQLYSPGFRAYALNTNGPSDPNGWVLQVGNFPNMNWGAMANTNQNAIGLIGLSIYPQSIGTLGATITNNLTTSNAIVTATLQLSHNPTNGNFLAMDGSGNVYNTNPPVGGSASSNYVTLAAGTLTVTNAFDAMLTAMFGNGSLNSSNTLQVNAKYLTNAFQINTNGDAYFGGNIFATNLSVNTFTWASTPTNGNILVMNGSGVLYSSNLTAAVTISNYLVAAFGSAYVTNTLTTSNLTVSATATTATENVTTANVGTLALTNKLGTNYYTRTGVYRTLYVDAAAMYASPTNSLSQSQPSIITNNVNTNFYMDAWSMCTIAANTNTNSVQFKLALPDAWNQGAIKVKTYWVATGTNSSAKTNCMWSVQAADLGNSQTINTNLLLNLGTSTAQVVMTNLFTTNANIVQVFTSSALTIPSLATSDPIMFQISFLGGNANSITNTLHFLGANIQYCESTTEPSSW